METAYHKLKTYYASLFPFHNDELECVREYFDYRYFPKGAMVFTEGKNFDFLLFIARGAIRHFHTVDGIDKTCDFSFEEETVTDIASFTSGKVSSYNLQAMEATAILTISRDKLNRLYAANQKFETVGRLLAQQGTMKITALATLHIRYTPEQRYVALLQEKPELFKRVPLKYIAQYLGIHPESLSRMRKRLYKNLNLS